MAIIRKYVSLGSILQILLRPASWVQLPRFWSQLRNYRKLESAVLGRNTPLRFYPCLADNQVKQNANNSYFYQDCWAARQVFRENPNYVVDVGSTVLLAGILSQFKPCFSVDIRPIDTHLEGLKSLPGSVLKLPFKDNEVPCLTTMCVLEHIGLGRYGDPLSPTGTQDAAREIARIVAPGGIVVYSVPVGLSEVLEFNACRRLRYKQAMDLFRDWDLVDSCILTPVPAPYTSDEMLAVITDPIACFCVRKRG